ncbi:CPS_collapsed_G0016890.mRNA.1.CDS.1 [Saccharomyces cerevisiae]|nr:CPS_collapsed_G0016890.mRNA.1.CDS.1 [Saccharomyces cerevisiae]
MGCDKFHYKIALRNCNELVQYMVNLQDELYQNWASVFHTAGEDEFSRAASQCREKSQWKWFQICVM